jgi:8-hydroxy-5-deazaflavin:NADPH oxidoreductase
MKIGVLGSGIVAQTLAAGLRKHGHEVVVGTRDPAKLSAWAADQSGIAVKSFDEAAAFGEVIVLAVKGSAAEQVVGLVGTAHLAGKAVMDTCNPIADLPPEHGVLRYFTTLDDSLMERLQRHAPQARFVKAFSSVGNARMVNPAFENGRPSMFICGNDDAAKTSVRALVDQLGWDTEDMGRAEAARAIEPLCMLWCIPGLLHNEWTHAFKVLH